MLNVVNDLRESGLLVGIVQARPVKIGAASERLEGAIKDLVSSKKDQEFPASIKEAVRGLLKTGGFKPSGRNKPASEYLAQAAREDRFPFINNLVDVNNLISLASGLPISLLDAEPIGSSLRMRFGDEGERYVFNASGQEIDLKGLICVCAGESNEPLGNPVKDSMRGKLKDSTSGVVGVIYSPNTGEWPTILEKHLKEFESWLQEESGATEVYSTIA